jgi:hypothetical protein
MPAPMANVELLLVPILLGLGWIAVQGHVLSCRLSNVEIDVRLFVVLGMLLSPNYEQSGGNSVGQTRPVDLRVTSRTESDRPMQHRLARFPMMHSGSGITAHPTGLSIAL